MTIKNIMDTLYGTNHNGIIRLLNSSRYIDDYDATNQLVFHTGFIFSIHTGTTFEVLYNYYDRCLVFQPHTYIRLPVLAGLIVWSKNGKYFETYSTSKIIAKINEDGTTYQMEVSETEIDSCSFNHRLEVVDNEELVIGSYPLSRVYNEPIFNGRVEFRDFKSEDDEF
jgi:hypothetical protein